MAAQPTNPPRGHRDASTPHTSAKTSVRPPAAGIGRTPAAHGKASDPQTKSKVDMWYNVAKRRLPKQFKQFWGVDQGPTSLPTGTCFVGGQVRRKTSPPSKAVAQAHSHTGVPSPGVVLAAKELPKQPSKPLAPQAEVVDIHALGNPPTQAKKDRRKAGPSKKVQFAPPTSGFVAKKNTASPPGDEFLRRASPPVTNWEDPVPASLLFAPAPQVGATVSVLLPRDTTGDASQPLLTDRVDDIPGVLAQVSIDIPNVSPAVSPAQHAAPYKAAPQANKAKPQKRGPKAKYVPVTTQPQVVVAPNVLVEGASTAPVPEAVPAELANASDEESTSPHDEAGEDEPTDSEECAKLPCQCHGAPMSMLWYLVPVCAAIFLELALGDYWFGTVFVYFLSMFLLIGVTAVREEFSTEMTCIRCALERTASSFNVDLGMLAFAFRTQFLTPHDQVRTRELKQRLESWCRRERESWSELRTTVAIFTVMSALSHLIEVELRWIASLESRLPEKGRAHEFATRGLIQSTSFLSQLRQFVGLGRSYKSLPQK